MKILNMFICKLNYTIFQFLGLLVINFWLLYPGAFTYDTMHQYKQAISNAYSSHHPPVMAYWWSIMLYFLPNPATMLFFHLLILTIACYNFYKAFEYLNSPIKYGFMVMIFSPLILAYSFMIWKDVSFSYSYLCAIAILVRVNIEDRKITIFELVSLVALIFYGTAVKYQARFILPILSFWFAHTIMKRYKFHLVLLAAFIINILFYFAQESATNLLISNIQNEEISGDLKPSVGNTNSWQLVKLYDLGGISLYKNQMIFPPYILNAPIFNEEAFRKSYNPYGHDDSVKDIYTITNNQQELDELWWFWLESVVKNPIEYLKHRARVFFYTANHGYFVPSTKRDENLSGYPIKDDLKYKAIRKYLLHYSTYSRFIFSIFFVPFYIVMGFVLLKRKQHDYRAKSLIYMNFIGLSFLIALFFFSMATEARYLLLPSIILSFSHLIFFSFLIDYAKLQFVKFKEDIIEEVTSKIQRNNPNNKLSIR
jgi:hypothetical protein